MVLTLARAVAIAQHAGYSDTSLPPLDLIDEAAVRMLQMHPWACTALPARHIGVRAAITGTGATWTTATRTLTKVAAFTTYVHAPGDPMTISAGATAVLRDYEVQERVSADAVILTEDIGATTGSVDIGFTLAANRAAILPSDFGSGIRSYTATQGLNQGFQLTSMQELTKMRSELALQPVGHYWAALWQAHNKSAAGGNPAWRLELWPYPSAVNAKLFTVSYRQAWERPTTDTHVLPIPQILEPLYMAVLRAVVRGYEEEEEAGVEDRIDRLRMSSTFQDAIEADGLMQPDLGPLLGGAEGQGGYGWELFPTAYTADPA
jgi:hypothetical protein